MTTVSSTTIETVTRNGPPANDHERIEVVFGNGRSKRKYYMLRYNPGIEPGDSVTGEVDFVKDGLWCGFADLVNGEYVFTKVRELARRTDDDLKTA